jgi:O-antigen/teichoic acid export membrane protein
VLGFAVGIIYSRKLLKNITFSFIFTGFKQIKGKVFVFGFNLVFNYLFFQLDTILLALWKGDYDVGIYQSVFKLILIPLVIPDIFINTLLPVLSRLNVENIERWKRVGSVMNKILFIVIIPITIIFFVYAPQIIGLIYGAKKYAAAVPILRVFALTLFVRFNLEAYALMLTTSERQHIRMKVVIVATALNLVLNYFMIRSHGAYGAAVVSLITNSFVGLMYYLTTLPLFKEWMFNFKIISVLLFSAGFGYLCWLSAGVTVFLSAPVIAGVFILIAYYYFFSKEEKKLIIPAELNLTLIKNRFF